ncbi:helix-turn-helix domain-containing protein [Streptomyces sp. NPDC005808]|uniref:helix-turn-helix domain-containing protein n=1 Tax=Streptomyces sp. NPDC005808 TaxID=3364734 RepID=UPI0036A7719A
MRWSPDDWARLGATIRESRDRQGFSRKRLAETSGVSEKSIQLTEEGRVPTRWPKSLDALEAALYWVPGTMARVLDGFDPKTELRDGTPADIADRAADVVAQMPGGTARDFEAKRTRASSGWASGRDIELTQSGHLAQDTFIRQMKRYRRLLNVSRQDIATRVVDLGGDIGPTDIARLENGTRLLKMAEAEMIARALETTVEWLLGSGFSVGVPDELKVPPTDEELQAEAKAVQRRIAEMGMQVNSAREQYSHARRNEEQARQQAQMALAMMDQVSAQQTELIRQYQYLIGRIDSLRAAKGEELIIQTYPVYEDGEERSGENSQPRPAHTASGDKAGASYPGSKAEQSARAEAARDAVRKLL